RGQVAVGIVQRLAAAGLGLLEVFALEQVGRAASLVLVELVDQHQVRTHPLQHRRDLARARVAALQARDQAAGLVVVKGDVVGGNAQRRVVARLVGGYRGRGGTGAQHRGQQRNDR